jgi:hypothetical protein
LKGLYPISEVRLEYPYRLFTKDYDDNRALDIWIQNPKIAIELKYATQNLQCEYDGEEFYLKRSRIHNYRYSFVEDISRIESLVWDYDIKRGFAIVVTNNMSMWSKGVGASEMFSLHDTLEDGKLIWKKKNLKKGPITLRGKYPMDWREYSAPYNNRFRYLIVDVTKSKRLQLDNARKG